jgi:hypothetical protein
MGLKLHGDPLQSVDVARVKAFPAVSEIVPVATAWLTIDTTMKSPAFVLERKVTLVVPTEPR